ncbi:MAG: type II secretion system protein [Candidatus Woesebacteria bacterium]|nr:MAG: type II secretion system protein [Candidatus Woesebacteria bacterium]
MKKGFTLIELLLVVAIISTIAILSSSFYSRFLTQNDVASTVNQLTTAFSTAQFYSIVSRKSASTGWGVNIASGIVTIYQGNSYLTRNSSFDEKVRINPKILVTGASDINFARVTGIPNTTAAITISGLGTTKTLSVNSYGVVSK